MTRFIATFAVLLAATASFAAPLTASLNLVGEDVATVDGTLTAQPPVDVYELELANPNGGDATSLDLSLLGPFINNGAAPQAFSDDPALPSLSIFTFAETFFLLPAGTNGTELAVDVVDGGGALSGSFTLPGTTALVPAGGSAVVAVLSVPADTVLDTGAWAGQAAVDGQFEAVSFGPEVVIPEPTTAALLALGLAGFAARRRA